jgi:hypothetical protein
LIVHSNGQIKNGLFLFQAVKALLEVVQLGGKNLEIAVMSRGKPMKMLALVRHFDMNLDPAVSD